MDSASRQMSKSKALELLKQLINEIPQLRTLNYDNQKFKPWRDRVKDVISLAFDDDDYQKFSNVEWRSDMRIMGDAVHQSNYQHNLTSCKTALQSIIDKYEILGVKTKPTMAKSQKASEDYEEKAESKELELFLQGTPDMILECIRSIVEKLNSQGYKYGFRRTSGKPDYATWDKTYFASYAISQSEERIGTIKLQLLPKERTLLKSPKHEDWNSPFGHFVTSLFAEFQRLGYVESKEEKPATMAEIPKAFIAHGGDSPALSKLKNFLEALGVEPIVVEEQPSEGRSVAENVDWYSRQADCAVILATKGDVDGKTGGFIPRGNVLMEIGKLQELLKDRIVYLVQAGTKLPTNINEKVRVRFSPQSMDDSFIKIAKELKKFGILKAVKPPRE